MRVQINIQAINQNNHHTKEVVDQDSIKSRKTKKNKIQNKK